jgi:hypothetical protein
MEQLEIREELEAVTVLAATPIVDEASYKRAAETLKSCKALQKKIEGFFAPLVAAANDTVKKIRDEMKRNLEPVLVVDAELRKSTAAWIAEQERQKAAEEHRRATEAAKARQAAEEQRKAEADFLAEVGLADTVPEAPIIIAEAVPEIEKAGIGYRENWKFIIENEDKIPREYMMVDEKKIGQVVRALKDQARIPGVRVYVEKSAIVR